MKTLDSPKGFVVCYSTFDASLRDWSERNTFQVLLARAADETGPAIPSLLDVRASLCSLTAAENGAEPDIAGLNLNSLGLQRGGLRPLQQHSENMDLSNKQVRLSRSLNLSLCGTSCLFRRTGKLGATPGTRSEWMLQTGFKDDPEPNGCKAW